MQVQEINKASWLAILILILINFKSISQTNFEDTLKVFVKINNKPVSLGKGDTTFGIEMDEDLKFSKGSNYFFRKRTDINIEKLCNASFYLTVGNIKYGIKCLPIHITGFEGKNNIYIDIYHKKIKSDYFLFKYDLLVAPMNESGYSVGFRQ